MTKKQTLEELKSETKRLAKYLGLSDWDIIVSIGEHGDDCVKNDSIATVTFNMVGRKARIVYSPFRTITRADITHELLHLMLADLELLIPETVSDTIISATQHRIIVRWNSPNLVTRILSEE